MNEQKSLFSDVRNALTELAAPGDPRYSEPAAWEALDTLETLLREAYTRLMVSEGDARYENNNIGVALRIAEVVNVE